VLYAPELACNATLAAAFANHSDADVWQAWRLLQPLAAPADLDLVQLRVDARRFGSVGALASTLNRMPAPARAALAAALTTRLDRLPGEIRGTPPLAAVALYGPLKPWVCLPTFEASEARVRGELLGAMGLVGDLLVRAVLRLDEAGAAIGAVLGDSEVRPRLLEACAAISEAQAAAANATAPELRAAGKAGAAAAAAAREAARAVKAAAKLPLSFVRKARGGGSGAGGAKEQGSQGEGVAARLMAPADGGAASPDVTGEGGGGDAIDPALV
jgi:hypothetical protein